MNANTQNNATANLTTGDFLRLSVDGGKVWGTPRRIVKVRQLGWSEHYGCPSVHVSVESGPNGVMSFGFHASELGQRVEIVEGDSNMTTAPDQQHGYIVIERNFQDLFPGVPTIVTWEDGTTRYFDHDEITEAVDNFNRLNGEYHYSAQPARW